MTSKMFILLFPMISKRNFNQRYVIKVLFSSDYMESIKEKSIIKLFKVTPKTRISHMNMTQSDNM
jgi:hypothetical protein